MAKQSTSKDGGELPDYLLNRLITIHADIESRRMPESEFITPHPNLEKLFEMEAEKAEPLPGLLHSLKMKPEGKPPKVIADKESPDIVLKTVPPRVTYHKLPKKRKVVNEDDKKVYNKMEDDLPEMMKLRGMVHMRDLIARMRAEPTDVFIYLIYALPKHSLNFHPYCYQVVTYYDITGPAAKHFLTMSSQGVIQCVNGDPEFYDMNDWEVDYSNWMTLIKKRTFWQFQLFKYFMIWRKRITHRKFNENRSLLEGRLIMVRPELRTALQQTQSVCESLNAESFFLSQGMEKLSLEEFMNIQMDQIKNVNAKLEESRQLIKHILDNSSHGDLLDMGFTPDDSNLKVDSTLIGTAAMIGIETTEDGRYKMSFDDRRAKKKQCLKISRCLGVADYLVQAFLMRLLRRSLKLLKITLDQHLKHLPDLYILEQIAPSEVVENTRSEDPKNPLFLVYLLMGENSIELYPQPEEWINSVSAVVNKWISTILSIKTFQGDPHFEVFTKPTICDFQEERLCGYGPNKEFVLSIDKCVGRRKKSILKKLYHNSQALKVYATNFEPLVKTTQDNNKMDPDSIKNQRSLEAFRQLFLVLIENKNLMESVVREQALGVYHIMFNSFRIMTIPIARQLLRLLQIYLPRIGKEKVDALSQEAQRSKAYLLTEPLVTTNFVEYLQYLDQIKERIEEMEQELEYLRDLYDLLEEFHVPVSAQSEDMFYDYAEKLSTLRNTIEDVFSKKEIILKKFNDTISIDIKSLMDEVLVIRNLIWEPWLIDDKSEKRHVDNALNSYLEKLEGIMEKAETLKNYQKQCKVEMYRFETLEEVINDLNLRKALWHDNATWEEEASNWLTCPFSDLNPDVIQNVIASYFKNIYKYEKGIPPNEIVPALKEKVEKMRDKLPTITTLTNPDLKLRHWARIEQILNQKIDTERPITLEQLEQWNIYKYHDKLTEISAQATSEAGLEDLLKKTEDIWKSLELPLIKYKDAKDVYILGGVEEIQLALDETNINLSTMMSSRNVGPIKQRVDGWMKQVDIFSKTLDEWLTCQKNWLYLEPIFSAPDIQRQLPAEAKQFQNVDKSWKTVMRKTAKNAIAFPACTTEGTYDIFKNNNNLLEQIMKCLEAYLESKRVVFPRFYFLSNEELLEILAQTRNPHAVQPHLRKCFDAIYRLEFAHKNITDDALTYNSSTYSEEKDTSLLTNDIKAMISPEGEKVKLTKGLKARGNVEDWLGKVEESMFFSLWSLMKNCLRDFVSKKRTVWVLNHASQLILTISQVMWVRDVHTALTLEFKNREEALAVLEKKCFDELNDLAGMVRGELTKLQRNILGALITLDVHSRDIVSTMVHSHVQSISNFEWIKQFRYYWEKKIDNCVACMASSRHLYNYEYLGASGRLVLTPLTDKCYLCLMGALQLDLGGAPAGPAGTGKTETTKDLAKALAIQCVVFNCSEGLDYKMMGRFFSGLAQCGSWCCFDEFNRIEIEVLSVIAQQLITIRNAKAAKLKKFMFERREIKLLPQCATFITMNPGYAGRTELPDNLKSVFRPFAMMVPDYTLIAEVILYSEGFESSRPLAQKMVNMYKLCSEQLSQQDHYDFGMRAVKSVLTMAGSLKRDEPYYSEEVVLIRALRDSNLPKFLAEDAILFQGILSDLFPGVDIPAPDYGVFSTNMESVVYSMNLEPEFITFLKTIQLYETMLVRHGVMTVGPTGGGKTTVLNVLKGTLTRLYQQEEPGHYYKPVTMYTLNPKSITMGELFGEINHITLEWKDGLLGFFVRTAVNCTEERHQWVVCDGPVDAVWVENLNTVLDDNKMLCLSNSERIKLTPWVRMFFEVQDLAQASPATVSRCGMVYIDPEDLKYLPYVKSWGKTTQFEGTFPDQMRDLLMQLFVEWVPKGLAFIKKNTQSVFYQPDISKMGTFCAIMKSFLKRRILIDKFLDWDSVKKTIHQCFVLAYLWSLGGNLTEASRDVFETFVRQLFEDVGDFRLPPGLDYWTVFYDFENKKLEPWQNLVENFMYKKDQPFFDMTVPTIDTVRFGVVVKNLINENYPVLLTGGTGVGKSIIAKDVINKLVKKDSWQPVYINFSAQSSSTRTQEMIESKLEKKRRNILGAPVGKRVIVFVDDVNMPRLEQYGSQPPIELLRQFLDFKGMYDREKLYWKEITDVVLCAACAPPGGGRNPMSSRFLRHFAMFLIPSPSEANLRLIFKSILKGFLNDFTEDIQSLTDSLVLGSIEIYQTISEDLLPTPAKSHYVFNLRDLSKLIQGLLQANSYTLHDPKQMMRLFFHESLRVFHDRLVNDEDRSYFYRLVRDTCSKFFSQEVLSLPEEGNITNPPVLVFADFMKPVAKEERIYEEITNINKLKSILEDYLVDFNLARGKEMKLIFFMDAVQHICRLARILRVERGNGLLVGVGGMGKQSLTNLAAHLNQSNCFQIQISRNYDYSSFRGDLRTLYYKAGAENEETVFLFTDTQILQEEYLEDINNILNTGEISNLFEGDDYEKVMVTCRAPAKAAGVNDSNRDSIYDYFISRVRIKLHLVICMSPIGETFRQRCRMFPSLVNCCTIDWYSHWPEEALISVAKSSLNQLLPKEYIASAASAFYAIHTSVEETSVHYFNEKRRHYYVTPSSYLDLLKLYNVLLMNKRDQLQGTRNKIANGLKKIDETNDLVGIMQEQLIKMEPQLQEKSEATAELMSSLIKEKSAADEVRQVVLTEEAIVKAKAVVCQNLSDDAQRDLDLAMPALEAATKALDSLDKTAINEVRVFISPPSLVKYVMEAVCVLLGQKPDWLTAKVVLGDGNFLKKLKEYDKDNIPDAILKKLKPYIDNSEFKPENVGAQSLACRSLCMWVNAVDTYAHVFRIVEPKRQKVQEAEKELNQIMGILRTKQQNLADVEQHIAALEAKYDASVQDKASLEAAMDLCAARLNRAGRLTSALADEQIRWEQLVESFKDEIINTIGDILIATGCVAYLGPFTATYREDLVKQWTELIMKLNLPLSSSFSLINVLADPYEVRFWNTCGLPRDTVSIESAVYVTNSIRWPLMIDPQEQANQWIRTMEAENSIKMIKLTDHGFMKTIINAIRAGLPVLIWEVGETLEPSLAPILQKRTYTQSGRTLIKISDQEVEYDNKFRLYITTKLPNPHYLPDICIQVAIINFTVTPNGLEEQLLVDAVRLEKPDLETQRTELIININKDKTQLKAIEDKILKMLYTSQGNILDDEELIETLNISKETSAIIASRLAESEETEALITAARNVYKSVAARGSCLYFVIAQLCEIDPMYQFSLKYFNRIFNQCISNDPKEENISKKLDNLLNSITLALYSNVSQALFEKDKLIFSFLLCTSIHRQNGVINDFDWEYFARGPVAMAQKFPPKPPLSNLTDSIWINCFYLDKNHPSFKGLLANLHNVIKISLGDLKVIFHFPSRAKTANLAHLNYERDLSLFEKLILIKGLKEEKTVFAITEYIKVSLGKQFVESPLISLHSLFKETSNLTPLIFVLSSGCDPISSFLKFAIEKGYKDRAHCISLGQGQGPIAQKMIEKGRTKGDWVFLQNCHLASSWMPMLELILLNIADCVPELHQDFRMFLSSMPSKFFPVSILQNAVKVTNEPPKGIRANLKRAFAEMDSNFFRDHPLGPKWRKMIFGLCFFHAIVLERKKFGPLGWNILYEFSESDRDCALLNLKLYCQNGKFGIPWEALQYITGEITYGGRVTDFWDQRTLKTILKGFFSPSSLVEGYKYSPSGVYFCPESDVCNSSENYKYFIENMPLLEEPEIFGMHENANLAFQGKETSYIINTIMEIMPKETISKEGKSNDEIVMELSEFIRMHIETKITDEEVFPMHTKQDDSGRVPPLSTVMFQEIDRFNKLLNVIHVSITDLIKAIKGFVVMSESLEEVYKSFLNNTVPKLWKVCAYPSLKPLGNWTRDLELRLDFINYWKKTGPPSCFWLPGLFFPQGFITGVLQATARKHSFPIDRLKIDFLAQRAVIDQEDVEKYHKKHGKDTPDAYKGIKAPGEGVFIHGLYLDAGRFDLTKMVLVDPNPGEINPTMPVLALKPLRGSISYGPRYEAPLYKTSIRAGVLSTTGHSTNFVIAVLLPSDKPPSYWILKGTALLTQINE